MSRIEQADIDRRASEHGAPPSSQKSLFADAYTLSCYRQLESDLSKERERVRVLVEALNGILATRPNGYVDRVAELANEALAKVRE